jgi:uncharacterized protein
VVSLRFRQALPLVALAVMLCAGMLRAQGPRQPPDPPIFKPFPEAVVAQAPALPQYAANAQVRIEQQFASANAMWTKVFSAADATYEPPVLASAKEGCGVQGGWAGIYCDGTIVIDVVGHVDRHRIVGTALEDNVLGYIVAHEVGHHVQSLQNVWDEPLRRELHAQCLAGVWGKAAGQPLPPMWAYAEDLDHGTVAQQVRWLNVGYRSARPSDCDTIWSTSTTP